MAAFGDVLRGLGSVLNPQVAQELGAEDRMRQQLAQQVGLMGLQQQMAQQSPEYQMKMEALKNERGLREAVIGAAGDEGKIVSAFMQFGKPELALNIVSRREERQSKMQQARETLEQRAREFEMRMEDRSLDRAARERASQEAAELRRQGLAMQAQIAQGNQELRRLQIEMMGDQRARAEARAATEKEEKAIESQVTKATTNLKDFGPALAAAQDLNKILSFYTPQNIPGAGYLKNTDIGKFFLDQSGKNVSSAVKGFGNAVLKAMSGAAVTAPEEIRQMAAQMADGRFSAEDFYIAWPRMADWVNSNVGVAAAGLSPKAKQLFEARAGISLDAIKPKYTFDKEQGKLVEGTGASGVIDFGNLK